MATMIPGDIEEFGAEGEKAFYKFDGQATQVCGVIGSIELSGLLGSLSHGPPRKPK